MNIVIDKDIVEGFARRLDDYHVLLTKATERMEWAEREASRSRLMRIPEACQYLGGISEETLLYYRKMGLDCYKKGKTGVWYRKGDIDDWVDAGHVSRHFP